MSKYEFLEKLKTALGNDLTGAIIQENVNYYDQYISDEVRKGRSEAEVIAELGDPWVLAQTIIDTAGGRDRQQNATYETQEKSYNRETGRSAMSSSGNGWWKIILVILGIIGVFAIVITVIGGVISFLAPVLFPVLLIVIIFKIFSKKR